MLFIKVFIDVYFALAPSGKTSRRVAFRRSGTLNDRGRIVERRPHAFATRFEGSELWSFPLGIVFDVNFEVPEVMTKRSCKLHRFDD